MAEKVSTRRQAREWAIQMLTSADLNPPLIVREFMDTFWEQLASLDESEGHAKPRSSLRAFAEERVAGVLEKKDEIDAILIPMLDNWDINRLGTIERAVLRMGVWEMKFSDVPPPVVINEAIDLTNWFASRRARKLVNAVLDRFAKNLTGTGEGEKSEPGNGEDEKSDKPAPDEAASEKSGQES